MRTLVVGAGGVGSAIASIAARSDALEALVIADVDPMRSARAAAMAGSPRVTSTQLDATSPREIVRLARACGADAIVNACDPRLNPSIFAAAYDAGCHYLDMAMTLSAP